MQLTQQTIVTWAARRRDSRSELWYEIQNALSYKFNHFARDISAIGE